MSDAIWERVVEHLNVQLGGMDRPRHQVNSKWKDLQKICNDFKCIFNRKMNSLASGGSKVDALKDEQSKYQRLSNQKTFSEEKSLGCFEIPYEMVASKKSRRRIPASFFKTNQNFFIECIYNIFRCTISTGVQPTTPKNELTASKTTKKKESSIWSINIKWNRWSGQRNCRHPHCEQSRGGR